MRTTLLFITLATLLVSCGGQPQKPQTDVATQDSGTTQIQQLLNDARNSESPEREAKQLQAAELLLQNQQRELAGQIIQTIEADKLPLPIYAQYTIVSARLAIMRGQNEQALPLVENSWLLDNLDSLGVDTQIKLTLLRAEIFALLGSHIASARQRIYIAPLLSEEQRIPNEQALWRSLMYTSTEDLTRYLATSFQGEYQGWLQLALIAKNNQGDLDEQVRQLESWQLYWQTHPANTRLPGGLELIQELAANRPQKIALMLPLTGNLSTYGKAVRDGFIAAYYQTRLKGGKVPEITVYDTEQSQDFTAQYYQAIAEGAELVIGPLEKNRVRLLFDELSLPVPTLALNRIDDYGQAPDNMYQFGLAPQDEARQIANIAFLENHRRALVIAPLGEWGDKVSLAFSQRWQELGGHTVVETAFTGQQDYSNSIKEALALQHSEDRAKTIRQLAGEPIEFSPRRRQDVDMVFLLARPQQARSIKPLLAFHYAGDLPVYSTSRLYTGYDNPGKDRDINGVRFTDMPWILNTPSALREQIDQELKSSKPVLRMVALGVDSFQLYPRLRQLQEIPNSRVYGQTGALKLNKRNEIERQMLLAKITGSRATLIPVVDQSLGEVQGNNSQP